MDLETKPLRNINDILGKMTAPQKLEIVGIFS
jgi:hypothetical protein